MKLLYLAGFAALQLAPAGRTREFRFERAILVPRRGAAAGCAALDQRVFAHALPSLQDVRLFSQGSEVPYALTLSNTASLSAAGQQAEVLNLGMRDGEVVFDLAMPQRPYTAVDLNLRGENFLGTAKVTGSARPGGAQTYLGTYTVFDLTAQKLGRNGTLNLQETSFAFLHVALKLAAATAAAGEGGGLRASPALVAGATVPPSREAQTVYTAVAQTNAVVQEGSTSRATFTLPAHVPVERVRFELQAGDRTSFSRVVRVTAHPVSAPAGEIEQIAGEITQVRKSEDGRQLRRETLSVPATLGANAREPATVVVSVKNGDDRPLAIASVVLEMRERKLCFPVPAGGVAMFYGDRNLEAARYNFSRTFQPQEKVRRATLGPEERNPEFIPSMQARSFTERHSALLWVALLGAIGVLGVVALRSVPSIGKKSD